MIIGAAVLAVLGLAGGGAWFFLENRGDEAQYEAKEAAAAGSASYVEAPPMLVNLRSGDGEPRFLKIRFIAVAADPGRAGELKDRLPAVLDALQPFLRELRPEDLNGSAALFRVKEEMLARATDALGAGVVKDILIQDLVQQ